MFRHSSQSEKLFTHYGVKLDANKDSRMSYINAIIQLMINIDREFAREVFAYMMEYKKDDKFIIQLSVMFEQIREVLHTRPHEEFLDSEISIGKTPPKPKEVVGGELREIEPIVLANDIVKIYQDVVKADVRWQGDESKP